MPLCLRFAIREKESNRTRGDSDRTGGAWDHDGSLPFGSNVNGFTMEDCFICVVSDAWSCEERQAEENQQDADNSHPDSFRSCHGVTRPQNPGLRVGGDNRMPNSG